jgi:putative addiction module CopG family antidote
MDVNVNLTLQREEMVHAKVASCLYASASAAVREALRFLEAQERLRTAWLEQFALRHSQGIRQRAKRTSGCGRRQTPGTCTL